MRYQISTEPATIIVKGTLAGGANAGTLEKNAQGQLVFTMTEGFKLPFGVAVVVDRIQAVTGDVTLYTLDSTGAEKLLKTITVAAPFIGQMVIGGKEEIRFKCAGAAEFQMVIRAFDKKAI